MGTRVLHWGPLFALFIIIFISITSINVILIWWPPLMSWGAFLHMLVYMVWNGLIFYHFLNAIYIGPGYLPLEWKPDDERDIKFLQYCVFCKGYKAPRAHHCRKCNRCILKMDHHCPWINNCCGHDNHGYFIMFLFIAVVGCSHSFIILCNALYRALNVTWYYYYGNGNDPIIFFNLFELFTVVFSIGLSLGVAIAVGALLYFQVKSAMKNETGIETWIITKAISRRSTDDEDFIYPYDLGSYWKNFSQVLSFQNGCRPLVQGITDWPLQESTHKYTFTIEQKQQKLNKRQRVVQYEIVEAYSGYWFPCSKGYKICCHPPISDEPRIMLVIGDKVLVSRWKRHWLYGECILTNFHKDENSSTEVIRHRGWFPRRCAVEVIGDSPTLERKKEL